MTIHISKKNVKKGGKYRLCKHKKWVALVLAGAVLTSGGVAVSRARRSARLINSISSDEEGYSNYDVVGYSDISLATNWLTKRVGEDNFVLLSVGDHDSFGTWFLEEKLKYCQEKGIGIGLVVQSNATNLADIYFDLEYVKGILTEYSVTYPVYLNVDTISEHEDMTRQEVQILVQAFMKKAELNHIWAGVCGLEENMVDFLSKYHCLMFDAPSVDHGNITKREDYYYTDSSTDFSNRESVLEKLIVDNGYNDPSFFKDDACFYATDESSLKSLAYDYQMSVADLRRYNQLYFRDLKDGDIVRIPSLVQGGDRLVLERVPRKFLGIDVSLWQGDIDWENVLIDYAIIQVRDFINEDNDPKFLSNVKGCLEQQIPMGFYAFSRAKEPDEIRAEAEYLISQLQGIDVTYPVYLDLEADYWADLTMEKIKDLFVVQNVKHCLLTWENTIKEAGYIPGIYCNESLYEVLSYGLGDYLDNFAIWLAGGEYYNQEIIVDEKKADMPEVLSKEQVGMRQISQKGKLAGISNHTDVNYCYADYENSYYDWEQIEFPKYLEKAKIGGCVLGVSGMFLTLKVRRVRKKRRQRMKKLMND